MLRAPQEEALAIMRRRFPVPRVVDADNFSVQGRSQVRDLAALPARRLHV